LRGKNETKDKVLQQKQKLSSDFFETVLLDVHSYKVHSFDVYKKNLAKSFNIFKWMKKGLWMNACMHDYARIHDEV
jgi:phosphoribosylformylglycinamidine (FGAM) synthase PurS component